MDEKQYSAEQVLAAAFVKRVNDYADARGWFILDTLQSWYGELEGRENLVAQMRKKYTTGQFVLLRAQLIIGNSAPLGTCEASAHKASVAHRCPNSAIMPAVGGRRAGTECVRYIGLRTKTPPKS